MTISLLLLFIIILLLILLLFVIIRTIWVFYVMSHHRRYVRKMMPPTTTTHHHHHPRKTLIVLGSGGHTTEICMMTQRLDSRYYHPIVYCKAITDTTSLDRVRESRKQIHHDNNDDDIIVCYDIPRSREVGQSFVSSFFTTIYAIVSSFQLIYRIRPNLLICNGPGTCLPILLVVLCYRILLWWDCPIIFIESYCRVTSLSLTGLIIYQCALCDIFIVHWSELQQHYPQAIRTTTFMQD